MPYFKNNDINVLFVHIPKTGGTSCENFFSSKFNIPLNTNSLYGFKYDKKLMPDINSSLQHITYNQMVQYSKVLNIDFDNIKIFTIVRNPYERVVSDLFFKKMINIKSNKNEVFNKITEYLLLTHCDNHNNPQHIFITDDNKNLHSNIHILKTEKLKGDMNGLGYTDFNRHDNANKNKINYYDYLNNKAIRKINDFYHLDFLLFNYDKILIPEAPPVVSPVAPAARPVAPAAARASARAAARAAARPAARPFKPEAPAVASKLEKEIKRQSYKIVQLEKEIERLKSLAPFAEPEAPTF